MADDTDTAISDAVKAITAPSVPDPKGLLDIAASVRRQIAAAKVDPSHPAFGKPDVIARMEQGVAMTLVRANVTEPLFNPQTAADAAHEAAFTVGEWNDNLAELVGGRIDALADTYSEERLAEMAGDVRRQLGSAEYDRVIVEAQDGLNPGEKLLPAVKADLPTLRLLAAQGRYNRAFERTRPKF
jgi:hypothetical protein